MERKFTDKIYSKKAYLNTPAAISPSSDAAEEQLSFIVLVTGREPDGDYFWAYLAIPCHKYAAYCAAATAGDFDLDEYGEVRVYGYGKKPSSKAKKKMIATYGLDEDFDERPMPFPDLLM